MYYRRIKLACYLGLVTQAIVNNFLPLLFLTMQRSFGISLEQLSLLVSVNFGVQLLTDLTSPLYVDRLGYWPSMKLAQLLSAAGLLGLCLFTELFARPFAGLLVSVGIYAVGGGLLEVLVSPIVEACPTDNKARGDEPAALLLLLGACRRSVWCPRPFSLILFGLENWRIMACLWALLPVYQLIATSHASHAAGDDAAHDRQALGAAQLLMKGPVLAAVCVMMLCAGAAEQGMSQWASAFAESLVSACQRRSGILLGPCGICNDDGAFARPLCGASARGLDLRRYMICKRSRFASARISARGADQYALAGACRLYALRPLRGRHVAGQCAALRPAQCLKNGGTTMFALLALAGDLGCSAGPAAVGFAAGEGTAATSNPACCWL